MKNTERFSNRVENYVRYRPHYPNILPFLKENIGLDKTWTIADIGSGTGISSEAFLNNGNTVYGVEPNKEMREAAEIAFKNRKNFKSINGTAEATNLRDHEIDLIVAGQAFHWFDKITSKKEFQRIVRPGAFLLLMWNERKFDSDFQQMYEQMLLEMAPAYEHVCQHNVDESQIKDFFSPHPYLMQEFSNAQLFDFEGLRGRLLSCSYAPLENDPSFKPIMVRLKQIFDKTNANGKIAFEYSCKLYYGRI